uniref:Uncharacterized protein n=1 Tax=Knipowitschia caucasica TaxID=637954 RepID=A0AAV2MI81_KNICA
MIQNSNEVMRNLSPLMERSKLDLVSTSDQRSQPRLLHLSMGSILTLQLLPVPVRSGPSLDAVLLHRP